MEKIVLVYNKGDGYECVYDAHVPVEYESVEALYVDLEEAIIKYLEEDDGWIPPTPGIELDFTFFVDGDETITKRLEELGMKVYKSKGGACISYTMPEILTLEGWFDKYVVNKNA